VGIHAVMYSNCSIQTCSKFMQVALMQLGNTSVCAMSKFEFMQLLKFVFTTK